MVTFHHTIASAQGLHARPVALICRCALDHQSRIEIVCRGRRADATDMIALMGLDGCAGDEIEVHVEGPDEDAAASTLRTLLQENL